MHSTIAKRAAVQEQLLQYPVIKEVYVNTGWDFYEPAMTMYILHSGSFNKVVLYQALCDVFPQGVNIKCTTEWDSLLLQGRELIWFDGKWRR